MSDVYGPDSFKKSVLPSKIPPKAPKGAKSGERIPTQHASGLSVVTKRELFAAMALQGMLSDPNSSGRYNDYVKESVMCADLLIEQLEENQ